MARPSAPVFLARNTYRRRRLADAARILPVLGAVLFMLPLLWREGEAGTAAGLIYIFTIWTLLIVLARVLSHRLGAAEDEGPGEAPR
ncbi:hypothetical protein [Pseudoroseicyclus sp. CXY001]|uniref:hypothetical protein n=1 Tax=Pseudoroseicyclus sp. CXY001 TaxID=3242492 RepID=UPI003571429A